MIERRALSAIVLSVLLVLLLGAIASPAAADNESIGGEIAIDEDAEDGDQFEYEVSQDDAVSDTSLSLTGVTSTEWENRSFTMGGTSGTTKTFNVDGTSLSGPNGAPEIEVTDRGIDPAIDGTAPFDDGGEFFVGHRYSYGTNEYVSYDSQFRATNPPDTIDELTLNIASAGSSGVTADIYISPTFESGKSNIAPDSDDTLVKSGWSPEPGVSGEVTVPLDTAFDASGTSEIAIKFQTTSDHSEDNIWTLATGDETGSISTEYKYQNGGAWGDTSRGPGIYFGMVEPVEDLTISTDAGDTVDFGTVDGTATKSASLSPGTTELQFDSSNGARIDVNTSVLEQTETTDAAVVLNSDAGTQTLSHSGTLSDGSTVDLSNSIDESLIGGETTLEITVSEDYDGPTGQVGLDYSHSATFDDVSQLEQDVAFYDSELEFSNPSPEHGEGVSDRSPEVSIDIDGGVLDLDGGSANVTFYDGDGTSFAEKTVYEAGTVNATFDGAASGENQWFVTAEDDYGGDIQSDTYILEAPADLEIRDEETQELIEGEESSVEVRFFAADPDIDEVHTRETTDGTIDMTGLPATEEFVATANVDGYETRRIVIDSIYDQSTIYLLNESANEVLITFDINDRTEDFPESDTKLRVEKALGDQEVGEYQVIAGDYLGAGGEFPAILERGARYRLSVENRDGQHRALGSFVAETDDFITLDIGEVEITPGEDENWIFRSTTEEIEETEQRQAVINYVDYGEETDQLEYQIVDARNESNVLHGPVYVSEPTEYRETHTLPEDDETNWVVEWEVTRDGETISDSVPIGGVGPLDWPITGKWLSAFGLFTIVGTASLFGGSMSRTGAVFVSVIGFALTIFGVLAIPYSMLMLAGVVSVVFKFAEQSDQGGFI